MNKPNTCPEPKPIIQYREHDAVSIPSSTEEYPGQPEPEIAGPVSHSKPPLKEPTVKQGLLRIIRSSWLNILLVFVPLVKLLGFATEDISLRTGEVIGGLLNATFGNAVELIISIISLTKNLVIVVQASILGSILSNLLLVLGMCFFCGGCKYKEQVSNITAAQTSAPLLFISVVSLLLPAAFYGSTISAEPAEQERADILHISRATVIILLTIYFAYLVFQLKTHKSLVSITVVVAISAEFLVSVIENVVKQWHISETSIGLILLPIVGNAAEHVTAVTVSYKNKIDLALNVAVGSSMQIALLVTPIIVIVGWGINVDMSLFFNTYETAVLFAAFITVNYLIMDGKSNWLEGFMLCSLYIIIAISFYYYPDFAAGGLD
ncbi:Sodium/calcium exchanger protein-domain-containing protein [Thamnidium elegans]|nr:Sodium/calcium exchanger protein-domain-containing protein [Thamnidium elegans]